MILQEIIDLKVGDSLFAQGRKATIVWRLLEIDYLGIFDVDGKPKEVYQTNFGMYYTFDDDPSVGVTLRSCFPHPKKLNLTEYSLCQS